MHPQTASLLTCLKAAADPVRLRLLAVCRQGECSVSELTAITGLSQPRVSQQLKQLCNAGLLERFRDGQRVYYRLASRGSGAALHRQVVQLLPATDPQFAEDAERLRLLRSEGLGAGSMDEAPGDRALHSAILELTVTAPVGDLLDIGCGRGRLLKLLSSRAHRAIGVDIDASARELARAELLLAGLGNCSLRKGNMYQLPFGDGEFDTIILDDVLLSADRPAQALAEAQRLLRAGGRLFLLQAASGNTREMADRLADVCSTASLRLAPPRLLPARDPAWLLAVARPALQEAEAA